MSGITVYITQYATTQGIYTANVVPTSKPDCVEVVGAAYATLFWKPDWHLTKEEANARALEMIAKKRRSIAKQVAKLDALEREIRGKRKDEKK